MKLHVLQENLKNSLNHLQKVVPSKPQLNILSSILIQVETGRIILSATDLYLGVKTEVLAETDGQGQFVVNGELFKNVINSLDKGKLDLEKKDNLLIIKQGKAVSKLNCQSSEEFPEFPAVTGDVLSIKTSDLEEIQEKVAFCASLDQSRPVLTAILLGFSKKQIEVVATDGFRLSRLVLVGSEMISEKVVLLSSKAFSELVRLVKQSDSDSINIIVSEELKQALVEFSGVKMYIRLIDGDYPPYERIIPPSFGLKVEFDSGDFLTEIKRAAIFSRNESNIVKISIEGNFMKVSAKSTAFGDYSGEININNPDQGQGEIAFNVNYLIDFISAIKTEVLEFQMNESLKPAMFRKPGDLSYFYIAMPFRVNN